MVLHGFFGSERNVVLMTGKDTSNNSKKKKLTGIEITRCQILQE
jgi:hypothetical protein